MGEVIFLLIFLVISFMFFVMTFNFPGNILSKTSGSPGLFPRILLVFISILIIVRIIQILTSKEKPSFVFMELFQGNRLLFIVSLILYAVLLKPIGYLITSIIFLTVLCNVFYRLEQGTIGTKTQVAVRTGLLLVFVLIMNFLFRHLLNVNLPAGILGF